MLRINPPTALLLLTDLVSLKPGDWVIQNVANSAVGRLVIRLARARGVKTMNVVRRESLFAELTGARRRRLRGRWPGPGRAGEGADRRRADPPRPRRGRPARRRRGWPPAWPRTAWSCNYGSMTGEDPVMPRCALSNVRRDARRLHPGPRPGLAARRPRCARSTPTSARQVMKGTLSAPVEKVYPIEEIRAAVAHAQRGERSGKILVSPCGSGSSAAPRPSGAVPTWTAARASGNSSSTTSRPRRSAITARSSSSTTSPASARSRPP